MAAEGPQGAEPPRPAADAAAGHATGGKRRQLAEAMADGIAWAEAHRFALRWAALAVAAGSLAFLLRTGHTPGWRRYGSLAELPPRMLAPNARPLPVVLHSVATEGPLVHIAAAHYPPLHGLVDFCRGRPPALAAAHAAQGDQLLACFLAGPVQPTEAGLQYLGQLLQDGRVQRLRLLSIVQSSEQPWAAAASEAAGAADGGSPALSSAALGQPQRDATAATADKAAAADEAAASAADGCRAAAAAAPQPQGGQRPMLWGELYASKPRQGLAAWLPQWRLDTAESLIGQGEAAAMEPIDLEWLGVSWRRIERLQAAQQAAASKGRGRWAAPRPSLARMARHAWLKMAGRSGSSGTQWWWRQRQQQ